MYPPKDKKKYQKGKRCDLYLFNISFKACIISTYDMHAVKFGGKVDQVSPKRREISAQLYPC